jgi:FkbM family methyltransferase
MNAIRKLVVDLFLSFGFSVRKTLELRRTEALARSGVLLELLATSSFTRELPLEQSLQIIAKSKSQLGQDVLALSQIGIKQKGFFVEFGATNGIELSNTYLLEKDFGWKGVLCEPAKEWHEQLKRNRTCVIDTRCVYSSTGPRIQFTEASIGELSTISEYVKSDANRDIRKKANVYDVETVTLIDLLSDHQAPSFIDFLSIDTEGSEYEILKEFDFSKYSFGVICVEHNFTENRERISNLLTRNGYSQVFGEYSEWDDWYFKVK